jgi:single-strand DNA-binding protein
MLIGHLTRDPELRYTTKGTPIAEICLAINRNYTLDSGEKREEVTFLDVTFIGPRAETVTKYIAKGRALYVEGRLRQETWDDKETGKKRSKLSVVGEGFQFLGGGGDKPGKAGRATDDPGDYVPNPTADPDDDIPF